MKSFIFIPLMSSATLLTLTLSKEIFLFSINHIVLVLLFGNFALKISLDFSKPAEAPVEAPKGMSAEAAKIFDEIASDVEETSAKVSERTEDVSGAVDKAIDKLNDDLCT
jgi:hypothetical protein